MVKKQPYEYGDTYACKYCADHGYLCVVVLKDGILTLLPIHRDDNTEVPGPEHEKHWIA